jgi:hypothetical protein
LSPRSWHASKFLQDRFKGDHKLSVLLRSVLQRFGGSDRQLVSEEAAEPGPGPSWAPWRLENGGRVYVGIIDFLAPWSSLNISDSLHIPNGRLLEYYVGKAFNPGASLMPPHLYRERFVCNTLKKFTFRGMESPVLEPRQGSGQASPATPRGQLLLSLCRRFSQSPPGSSSFSLERPTLSFPHQGPRPESPCLCRSCDKAPATESNRPFCGECFKEQPLIVDLTGTSLTPGLGTSRPDCGSDVGCCSPTSASLTAVDCCTPTSASTLALDCCTPTTPSTGASRRFEGR